MVRASLDDRVRRTLFQEGCGLRRSVAAFREHSVPQPCQTSPALSCRVRMGTLYRAVTVVSTVRGRDRAMRTSSRSPSGDRSAAGHLPISCQPHDI